VDSIKTIATREQTKLVISIKVIFISFTYLNESGVVDQEGILENSGLDEHNHVLRVDEPLNLKNKQFSETRTCNKKV